MVVNTKDELLQEKENGHRYSRPTRRIVRILDLIRGLSETGIDDLVSSAVTMPEFYWTQKGGVRAPISVSRARAYVNFARVAGFLVDGTEKNAVALCSDVPGPDVELSDDHWTMITSQKALEYLQLPLGTTGGGIGARNALKNVLDDLAEQRTEASIDAIARHVGITGDREQEIFRWALLLHFDGKLSRFDLRFTPRVVWRSA